MPCYRLRMRALAGLVEVEWDGKTSQVFTADLRNRGELLKARSAKGGASALQTTRKRR